MTQLQLTRRRATAALPDRWTNGSASRRFVPVHSNCAGLVSKALTLPARDESPSRHPGTLRRTFVANPVDIAASTALLATVLVLLHAAAGKPVPCDGAS
ncbi:hypothetical protein [Methylobacterium iners]|uniref:hypothetical protein n=1 Tax=Methylobacterium iners TaxID=418707 RepID=UPI001EE1DD3A|nr:hypothetical protein [Methylobacterium iners]